MHIRRSLLPVLVVAASVSTLAAGFDLTDAQSPARFARATAHDQGKIDKVERDSVTVTNVNTRRDASKRTYSVTSATKVELAQGQGRDRKYVEGKLSDLKSGDLVDVEYEQETKAAVRIRRSERK